MRHTISVLVENTFGVLTRVAGMFSGRGYNIDSLNVAPTHDPEKSRMTIVTRGDDATVEQIVRQLYKLVNVLEITDFREHEYIDRELVMVRVKATAKNQLRNRKAQSLITRFADLPERLLEDGPEQFVRLPPRDPPRAKPKTRKRRPKSTW